MAFLGTAAADPEAEAYEDDGGEGDEDCNDDEDPPAVSLEENIDGEHNYFSCVEVVASDEEGNDHDHAGGPRKVLDSGPPIEGRESAIIGSVYLELSHISKNLFQHKATSIVF